VQFSRTDLNENEKKEKKGSSEVSTKVAKPIFGSPLYHDCINPLIGEKGLHLLVMKALLDFSEKWRSICEKDSMRN
ncbi:hypothetical protein MKW98_027506, partial [Papaver atlanticum]